MRKWLLQILSLLLPTLLAAQSTCYNTDPEVQSQIILDYEGFADARPAGIIFQSPKLSLWEDHATNITEWNPAVMDQLFGVFHDVIGRLEDLTGVIPHLEGQRFGDRIQLEVTEEREFGLEHGYAHPGVSKIGIGWEHLHELYHRYEIDIKSIDPEFINLFHKTYWVDQFNSKLNYLTSNSPDGFDERDGMWTEAMGDLFAITSKDKLESIDYLFLPTRHKPDLFVNARNALNAYRSDIQYNWNNSFNSSRLPWEPDSTSTPLLLTGMMHELYQSYGEDIFLRRFYEILPFLDTVDQEDHQAVRDNIYIASSYAAIQNISHYFNDLKWSLSDEASNRVDQLVSFGQVFNRDPLPYAFDKFTYDLNEPNDLNDGDGWAHPWSSSQSTGSINTDFSDFVTAEETAGPALIMEVEGDSLSFSRPLAQSFGCPTAESTWFSFQVSNLAAGGEFYFNFGGQSRDIVSLMADHSIFVNGEDSGMDLDEGESAWFVGQFESRASEEVLRLWINPSAGSSGPGSPANADLSTNIQNVSLINLQLKSSGALARVAVDEIKVGKSWWDISARPTSQSEEIPASRRGSEAFALYPNPLSNQNFLHIEGPRANAELNVHVFDLLGRKINEISGIGRISTDYFSDLGHGNYYLQLRQGEIVETRVLSKQH